MSAPAVDPRHTREHWNPGNLHTDCAACRRWLETVETEQDTADADAAVTNLLRLSLGIVLAVPGLFISALWFFNLGTAKGWHLTGPVLLGAAVYLIARTLTRTSPRRRTDEHRRV